MIRSPASVDELRQARRVLVCLRYGIGDVVMQQPCLRAVRRACPRAHIVALGAAPAVQLLEDRSVADTLVTSQELGLRHLYDNGDAAVRERLETWLAEHGPFDLVFDALHAVAAVRSLLWEQGISTLESDQQVLDQHLAKGDGAAAAIAAAAGAGWGVPIDPAVSPSLRPRPQDVAWARGWLREHQAHAPPAISPVASLELKRWPPDRCAAVADRLVERFGSPMVVFAGPQQSMAREMINAMRHPEAACLIGPEHLLRIAALLDECRVLVSNDTGLLHMSAAVQTPTLGIFGPTSPRVLLPRAPAVAAARSDVPCAHRSEQRIAFPRCWSEGRCAVAGLRSCVDTVPVATTAQLAESLAARTTADRRGA